MSLITYLVLGALVGWLAAKMAGRDEGVIASIFIGIIGSYIGGFLSRALTTTDQAYLAFTWSGLFWSFIGALIFVLILNALQHKPHHPAGLQ